jgi:hypothetical protein
MAIERFGRRNLFSMKHNARELFKLFYHFLQVYNGVNIISYSANLKYKFDGIGFVCNVSGEIRKIFSITSQRKGH